MRSNYLFLSVLLLLSNATIGQVHWRIIKEVQLQNAEKSDRASLPSSYKLFALDLNAFKLALEAAPKDTAGIVSITTLQFPNGEGELSDFIVYEAPIMESGLMAKFPNLKSYRARSIQDPRIQLRFSITDFGLHVMSVNNSKSSYFIDTYTKDLANYIVYYKKDCTSTEKFNCNATNPTGFTPKIKNKINQSTLSNDGIFRQYRMALTASSDYSQFHIDAAGMTNGTLAQQKSAVLSALVVTMTRVNGIFERDLGIRMNLVANNDLLILIGPDSFQFAPDNFLDNNIALTDATIGHENYDIGHVVMTIGYNMGVAALCAFDKAAGTTGSYTPVGDPFVIDYLSHEIGHQFGAGHTFYSSCGDMADDAVSVEPGGGTTIMSYAGICDPVVQNHADAYFTAASILQIQDFVNQPERNCSITTPSGSIAPEITPLDNYTIPKGTPFILKGNATATNQSALTYCWEQIDVDSPYDNAQPQPPLSTNILGPNFRSFPPTSTPDRYFPSFSSVMQGKLYPKWEVTSNVARTMKFAFTVRDNNLINGGQTQSAMSEIYVSEVGPFKITSPNQVNTYFPSGVAHYLTWDVAGTTENGINTETVTVLISTDNGVTFTPLLSNILNDGSEWVQFPNIESAYCRIMITPDNSVYYALSPNFSLGVKISTTCTNYTNTANATIPLTYNNGGYTDITINVPTSKIIGDVNFTTTINHTQFHQCEMYLSSPTNPTEFVHLNNGFCYGYDTQLKLKFDDDGTDINCESSSNIEQTIAPYQPLSAFIGQNQQGNWTLRVKDTWDGDDGTITSWNLNICGEVADKICATTVTIAGTTKTYNGGASWNPSQPTINDHVIIGVNGSPAPFVCKSLDLNGKTISITGTRTIEVVNDIIGNGKINIATSASLLQRNNSSVIEPIIVLDKRTRTNMYPLDYIYWGSPLEDTPLSMLDQAISVSGGGTAGAFDSKYKYVSGDLTSLGGWQPLDAITPGNGFIMRIKQATPFATLNTPVNISIKQVFQGIANNGNITVPVAVTTNPLSARNNNLLSNPYPSAIDANTFLANNPILDGVVYLWKAQTPTSSGIYTIADYIAYTRAGSTTFEGIGTTTPFNGMIATGQGFKVRALASGNVIFNNCMRVSGNNTGFMKESFTNTTSPSQVNRYKLNLTDSNGNGNQILVAYLPETTLGYDRMYDAELLSVSNTKLYTFLDNSTKKLAINARPNFEITDSLNIGFSKTNAALENVTITVSENEGVFANNQTSIYLLDTFQNQLYNLSNAPCIINLNDLEINNRYKIVYQNTTLSNNSQQIITFNSFISNNTIFVNSNSTMLNLSVFDLLGRLVMNTKINNSVFFNSDFYFEEGVYVIKVELINGKTETFKLINND